MKLGPIFFLSILSFTVLGNSDNGKRAVENNILDVVPLNSPVKESVAKFLLKLPSDFEVDKVKVKLVNAFDLKKDQKKFEDIKVLDKNELHVGVSKLPPGFYQLHIKVQDKKTKKEHQYKTKYLDYVRFVIDESMQVPMPDPKKNNATIGGVDSDNDGIRDDVQRYINENYGSSPMAKFAVRQLAVAYQADLVNAYDKEYSILSSRLSLDSVGCLGFIFGNREAYRVVNKIRSLFLNSKQRIDSDIQSHSNSNGLNYTIPNTEEEEKSKCNFNLDYL